MPDSAPVSTGRPNAGAQDAQTLVALKADVSVGLVSYGLALSPDRWQLVDLQLVQDAVTDLQKLLGGADAFRRAVGGVTLERLLQGGGGAYAWWIFPTWHRITLGDDVLHQEPAWRGKVAVVHELAHIWDAQSANWVQRALGGGGRIVHDMTAFVGTEPGPTCYGGLGAPECTFPRKPVEEWAESVASYCYPQYIDWLHENNPNEVQAGLRPLHKQFVAMQIQSLQRAVATV